MGGLALIARSAGHTVTGCDAGVYPPMSDQLRALGIELIEGFDACQMALRPDVFVIGNVVSRARLADGTPKFPLMEAILDAGARYTSGPQWMSEHILQGRHVLAVAGTHGKTTTSTLVAHLLHTCNINFTAFLGGISSNFGSNYIRKTDGQTLPMGGEIIVLEADEFDRSFHRLNPDVAIITAMDPDHLDIYGTAENFTQAFADFTKLIRFWGGAEQPLPSTEKPHGAALMLHESLSLHTPSHVLTYHYGLQTTSQAQAQNVRINQGDFCFDWVLNNKSIGTFRCGLPGHHNVQNALAALGVCHGFLGLPIDLLQQGIATFKGAKRRFEYIHKTTKYVVIDDYAHHPEELNAIIGSVKTLYPNQKITGLFLHHLFIRTHDFAQGFADSLAALDQIYLMEIYPARELPIPGVNSTWLLSLINNPNKSLVTPNNILNQLSNNPAEVLLILGAGDIDRIVQPIQTLYHELETRN